MGGIFSTRSLNAVDMASEKSIFVKDLISQNKVVIFSKSHCPYCTMAKEVCICYLCYFMCVGIWKKVFIII